MDQGQIAIVSGLPRSGTSMLMKMLEAGGMQVLTDSIREVDKDNPKGYYEFEKVKQIDHDKSWLEDAEGKVVKMVSQLLQHLPPDYKLQSGLYAPQDGGGPGLAAQDAHPAWRTFGLDQR